MGEHAAGAEAPKVCEGLDGQARRLGVQTPATGSMGLSATRKRLMTALIGTVRPTTPSGNL